MRGMRAALRIARREALRSKGRSALVVAMIGLPMLGLAFADVTVRTAQLSNAEKATRELGAADLVAEVVASGPIEQQGLWSYGATAAPDTPLQAPPREPDLARLLPPGSRVTLRESTYGVRAAVTGRVTTVEVQRVDLADPLSAGLVRMREGAVPRAAGEAAVTRRLARVLGVGIGDTVKVGAASYRVTATVDLPSELGARDVLLPLTAAKPEGTGGWGVNRRYAVDLPPGVRDVDLVRTLNQAGLRALPRTWFLDPPPDPYDVTHIDAEAVGVTLVAVGLATLEIVLLAGTAFAVGARRKRRELALVAATGGDRRDVRRIVLAEGVVVGAVAGVVGVAGGIAAVFFGRPLMERLSGSLLGPLDVRPLELLAIVGVAAGTALLASLLPARAASRQAVVSALTGRRGDVRTRRRVPAFAVAAIVCGAALAFWAAGEDMVRDGGDPSVVLDYGRRANFSLVLTGAVLAELGFVAFAPALVGLVGRLATRLPLSLRLAARDAARHRTRSGPAVAAVVAAVAGSVALSVYLASDTERQRLQYEPMQPTGAVAIGRTDGESTVPEADLAEAARLLPVRDRVEVHSVAAKCGPTSMECGGWAVAASPRYRCEQPGDPGCMVPGPRPSALTVADERYVSWWTGGSDPGAARALADGLAVVFDERWLQDGRLHLRGEFMRKDDAGAPARLERRTVPAYVARVPAELLPSAPSAVLSADTATRLALPTEHSRTVLFTTRNPTEREEAAARDALTRSVAWYDMQVERGFRPQNGLALLALLGAAAVVTLGATGIATGLAAADSRPDLATLAAVGAAPKVRRRLAMAQAATVAALGSGLGILAGLVPAVAVVGARAEFPLELPWGSFAGIGVGIPVVAALLVGLVTRSRLPLERRVA